MKERLSIGKILSPHGLKGEVRIEPWADSPLDLKAHRRFYRDETSEEALQVLSFRLHKQAVFCLFEGYDTIEKAKTLKNQILYIERKDFPLPRGRYFIQDLIGMQVFDADKKDLLYGTVTQITQHGSADVYHLKDASGKIRMFPAIKEVLLSVDLEQNRMYIRPLKGLFEDED